MLVLSQAQPAQIAAFGRYFLKRCSAGLWSSEDAAQVSALAVFKLSISADRAQKFTQLSTFLSTLLAIYAGKGKIWN